MKIAWVKCDKCGDYTLTPYSQYEYTLCPTHYFEIKKMVNKYMDGKQ